MYEKLLYREPPTYFDILDDKTSLYPGISELVEATDKKFILSPYFMGCIENGLANDLDVFIKGYVSYSPYCDFWGEMIRDPLLLARAIGFFIKELPRTQLTYLQEQVGSHFDPLFRAALCYLLNKVTQEGTITCGSGDPEYKRVTHDMLNKVLEFEYKENFTVEHHNWKFEGSPTQQSVLLLLPHKIQRGLADTGSTVPEQNTLSFSKLKQFEKTPQTKIILGAYTTAGVIGSLQNYFDIIRVDEKEGKIGVIAHNV